MTIQNTAIEKLRHLPEPLAQLVNDFIDGLISPRADQTQSSPAPSTTLEFTLGEPAALAAWNQAMVQIAAPDPGQHAAVASLFAQWATEDATEDARAEQQETLQWLTQALDQDRLSNRPLFP
jgi:hypothetical protein